MTLKLIPHELPEKNGNGNHPGGKHWNPGNKIKKNNNGVLKNICLRLIHFINRGSRFTYQQIDELILVLHQSILGLQKKKQELLQNKRQKKKHQ